MEQKLSALMTACAGLIAAASGPTGEDTDVAVDPAAFNRFTSAYDDATAPSQLALLEKAQDERRVRLEAERLAEIPLDTDEERKRIAQIVSDTQDGGEIALIMVEGKTTPKDPSPLSAMQIEMIQTEESVDSLVGHYSYCISELTRARNALCKLLPQ